MQPDPLEQPAHRHPRAVGGKQLGGERGPVGDRPHPAPRQRRLDQPQAGGQHRLLLRRRFLLDQARGDRRPVFGLRPGPLGDLGVGGGQAEGRVGGDGRLAEAIEPADHRRVAAPRGEFGDPRPEQLARPVERAAFDRVADRPVPVAVLGPPVGGAPMQPLLLLGLGAAQLGAQHLAEERVEAEPLVAAVERGEQHVRARELAQLRRRAAALEDRVAEVAAQPVEDRGAAQEVELAAADRLEEFFPDVVDDEAVVAGEAVDRLVRARPRRAAPARPGRAPRASPRCAAPACRAARG